jgi:hypothetical protein
MLYSFVVVLKKIPVDNTIGGERAYMCFFLDPKRIKAIKGPRPDRKTSKCFVVKIQSGKEYRHYNPNVTVTTGFY